MFQAAELDYTTLGNEEVCCGSELLRLGELGLFEELSATNRENFREPGFTEIVTTSPHCMNTFRSENPKNKRGVHHYGPEEFGLSREQRDRDLAAHRHPYGTTQEAGCRPLPTTRTLCKDTAGP